MAAIYQNILLPVDGSQQSIESFKRGIIQAKVWGSNVYLVQVLPEKNRELKNKEQNSFLNALERYANNHRITLHKELIYGDPRTQIAEELVDDWAIDLIIMGATGKDRVAKILVGSITTYVVRNAKCDVIISR